MIYLDTSCLVKVLRFDEEDADRVMIALSKESLVVVSALGELETLVDLKAGYMGGDYGLSRMRSYEAQLFALRNEEPFQFKPVPNAVWETAFRQHRNSQEVHCRTLDRLHLAIMEKLGINRLMTHDVGQAKAARELNFEVIQTGR
jgi:predicted nucleic acid-binding protein